MPPWLSSYISRVYLFLLHDPISPTFIGLFILCDQIMCLYYHYCTPSKTFTVKETLIHVGWGFLNTKTYTTHDERGAFYPCCYLAS